MKAATHSKALAAMKWKIQCMGRNNSSGVTIADFSHKEEQWQGLISLGFVFGREVGRFFYFLGGGEGGSGWYRHDYRLTYQNHSM